ncbi:hypothetical protein ACXZ9C_10955 [Streptococcus agalactiae]
MRLVAWLVVALRSVALVVVASSLRWSALRRRGDVSSSWLVVALVRGVALRGVGRIVVVAWRWSSS